MSVKSRVPELRFRGFSGEWEEKELEEVVELTMGQSPSSKSYNSDKNGIPLIQGNADIKNRLSNPRNWTTERTKECIIGDLILTVRAPVGAVAKSIHNACIGRGVCAIRTNIKNSNEFIYQFLLDYETKWSELEQGSTFTAISGAEIKKINLKVPSLNEQTKIGNYFQNLDKLIEQKEKKYQKLGQLKKAILEKMFPKEGATTPEIRFKGFSGEWEEKSLDEIGNATSGTSIESEFLDRGKYKVISIGSYSEHSTYTDQGIRANLSKKTQKRILNKNDLTMVLNDKTASGNILGRVLLIEDNDTFIYNQRTQRIELYQDEYVSPFIYQLLNAPLVRRKIINKSQGNTQIYVNWSGIKELCYLIPQKNEQTKIGNYFQKLDHLIDLQNQELQKLKNIKKASLAKMFV